MVAKVASRDFGMVKVRTDEVEEGILISVLFSTVQGRDGCADIQTAQSCAVEVMAILETVGRHPTRVNGLIPLKKCGIGKGAFSRTAGSLGYI